MGETATIDFERTEPSGQMVLHDFRAIIGYETATLRKHRNERFCVAFVANGGHPGKAYQSAINPDASDEQARKNASKLLKKDDIRRRITELSAVVRNRTLNDLIDFRLKGLRFDPSKYFDAAGNRRKIHDIEDEHRIGIGLESRVVEGCIVYVPVFPSPEKSADALQKIMGLDKNRMELTGKDGGALESNATVTIYIPANGRD